MANKVNICPATSSITISCGSSDLNSSNEFDIAEKEYKKINKVIKKIIKKLNMLISKRNKMHVRKEANVPGAYLIFPIQKKVKKIKLNFLIMFNHRNNNF